VREDRNYELLQNRKICHNVVLAPSCERGSQPEDWRHRPGCVAPAPSGERDRNQSGMEPLHTQVDPALAANCERGLQRPCVIAYANRGAGSVRLWRRARIATSTSGRQPRRCRSGARLQGRARIATPASMTSRPARLRVALAQSRARIATLRAASRHLMPSGWHSPQRRERIATRPGWGEPRLVRQTWRSPRAASEDRNYKQQNRWATGSIVALVPLRRARIATRSQATRRLAGVRR
jgi:hypothetical protein